MSPSIFTGSAGLRLRSEAARGEVIEAEDGAVFQLNRTFVTAGDTDRVALGSFDGEAIREIMIRFWIKHAEAPLARDFKVYPGGVAGTAATVLAIQTGAVGSGLTRNALCFAAQTAREELYGWLRLQTELDPDGTPTAFHRRFEGFTTLGDDPPLAANTGFHRANGQHSRVDGAVASADIVSTLGGSTTLSPAIGLGSVFEVWYLKP